MSSFTLTMYFDSVAIQVRLVGSVTGFERGLRYDSMLWHNASNVTAESVSGGMVSIREGSTTEHLGIRTLSLIPFLSLVTGSDNMAVPLHSLPVPQVVGTATMGSAVRRLPPKPSIMIPCMSSP